MIPEQNASKGVAPLSNKPPALTRRVPRVHDLAPLMQFKKPQLGAAAKLRRASTIWDLRDLAKRRTPKAPFDYTDGAAESEITLRRAREAFTNVEFRPGVLRNVETVDLSTTVMGRTSALPFGIAPTGFTRMMQSEGEYAGSQAAAAAGIPYTLSTMGTASIEDVAAAAPDGRNWFQLYLWTDRQKSRELIDRAAAAGFDTLMVTVDTAVAGERLRDVRNGMTIPPALTLKTVLDASYRPAWWFNFLTHEPLSFASLNRYSGTVADLINSMFDPTLTFDDLEWLRRTWKGNLVVKGIQTLEDARKAVDYGADGIVVSNHGGRQLDRAPIPLHLLPEIAAELKGKTSIILDTGIMSGGDIVAALALGADFTLIGRAYLYGLMAGGRAGVDRTIEILSTQAARTLALMGVDRIADLKPEHVRLLSAYAPLSGSPGLDAAAVD
ncbi:alpha-hydroxy-acid oxidizing protein [Arthrobacter sp. zg-Y916]|uniref:Alpha-hydroxy-acid oxidizing protein n=2 Tax=Arthrobacter TaxID=1663 RepID=A0A9X1MAV2_9MICC|nr:MULTISPECIES: alpha-hydroxy acid oxidase [Arthrobacter]MCC3281386.1 alpha-hydroxy-acid oxidizing protein [Arthrobacter caoxuetaonis]MCC3296361.1 alpha-hydroxy-acid oxidizing protein [Arthrobacter caoxuetaonis]MCC9192437.1 alpha-hydroxy-acid oxidizing protein [Arthrobacter sp. zg-Y916]USQ56794.1 alpha-hydroxy-acid oxidizing protein [Arthrobacter caoxuetaonis]